MSFFRRLFLALALVPTVSPAQNAPVVPPLAVPQQEIWISPRQNYKPGIGIRDWDDMFKSDAAWPKTSAAVKVFILTGGVIEHKNDEQMATMAAFLASHHIETALETGAVLRLPDSKKPGGEGYASPQELLATAKRLKKYGMKLDNMRIDEAIWFGHYDKGSPQAEQYSIPDLIQHVAEDARVLINEFPDIKLVAIETAPPETMQPDFQSAYKQYMDGVEAALGRKFTAMHLDLAWTNPAWKKDAKMLYDLAHSRGMKFGIIYDADHAAVDDRDFITNAQHNYTMAESEVGIISEEPIFQSWDAIAPSHALPETDPTAHTYLITQYLLPRTQIVAHRVGVNLQGVLADEKGQPVAGATVALRAPSFDPDKALPLQSVTGTVPPTATKAILGIRVNCECLCDGDNDLLLGPFHYQESGTGTLSQTIDYPAIVRKSPPKNVHVETKTIGGQEVAHIVALSGQTIGFNSGSFAVTPGASFTAQIPADLLSGEGLFGRVMVIWFDAQGKAFHSDNIAVSRQLADAGTTVTDASGGFSLSLPSTPGATAGPLRLEFAGSPTLRPAIAVVP